MSIVAIVGRPNVGKSTLFNRLVGMRQAIVDDVSGVTRDRHYGNCEWCGREFSVIDTGGYTTNSDDVFESAIRQQVEIAIDESDVVLFLVEAATGVTDYDAGIADVLRRSRKPVILCVNKVDTGEKIFDTYEFYSLGLGEVWSISAANGSGTGDLLDEIIRVLPEDSRAEDSYEGVPRIAIVGKPNVGKSSLTNALLGEQRNIVTPVAGTTRDSIETYYNKYGHEFVLVDTAGIRRKSRVHEDLEFYSVMRSIRAIEHSDICIMMIDATAGMEAQDMNIFNLIRRNRKGCVLVVNKWDLFVKDSNTLRDYTEALRSRIAPSDDVPIVFSSVLKMQRIQDVLNAAAQVWENYSVKIPTARLNEVLLPLIEETPPPAWKGKYVKIKYVTQLPTRFPAFAFFCNLPQYVKEPYKRFLENKIRENFPLTGCPVQIYIRQK
ncbi:MAG: ribosome biogenesis GTPase Der [Candidatus Cryptobacteroides sp.]|nr:ribosome biogenesis GTPase Der [Candidatus Cryptobacteroides sp.]